MPIQPRRQESSKQRSPRGTYGEDGGFKPFRPTSDERLFHERTVNSCGFTLAVLQKDLATIAEQLSREHSSSLSGLQVTHVVEEKRGGGLSVNTAIGPQEAALAALAAQRLSIRSARVFNIDAARAVKDAIQQRFRTKTKEQV